MADYNITNSNGNIINVPDGAALNTYAIPLVGQNTITYGDDVARAFINLLENFASDTAPELNTNLVGTTRHTILPGQLWYDTANGRLNVNSSLTETTTPTWSPIASVASGVTTDAMLRWTGTGWVEENQIRATSGGVFRIFDAGSDNVSMSHNGTNFIIDGTSTTNAIIFDNVNSHVQVQDGAELRVSGGAGNSQAFEFVPGDAASDGLVRTVGLGRLRLGTSTSKIDVTGALGLAERGSAPSSDLGFGRVWVNSTDNGLYYTNEAGTDVRIDVSAGGTVTATNGANNRVAVFSTATNVDGDSSFTFDATDVRVDSGGGFVAENGAGAIAIRHGGAVANITTTGTSVINIDTSVDVVGNLEATSLDIVNTNTFQITNGTTTTFDVNGASALNIRGMDQNDTGLNLEDGMLLTFEDQTQGNPISIQNTGLGGNDAQLEFTSGVLNPSVFLRDGIDLRIYNSTNTDYAEFDHNGTDFNIRAVNTTAINIIPTGSELGLEIQANSAVRQYHNNVISSTTQAGTSSGQTTRFGLYDTTGTLRNSGFNETPLVSITGARDITISDIGKLLSKTNTATFAINCPNNASIPIGATLLIMRDTDASSGTLTITATGTLEWINGSGAAATTGTRTLARNSIATLRKKDSTTWQIWGNGIS